MKEIHYWEAYDGKQFDDELDCEKYEFTLDYNNILSEIKFLGEHNKKLKWSFDDKFYSSTETVIINNEEQIETLHKLANYCGWCCFEDIISVGKWKFGSKEGIFIKKG